MTRSELVDTCKKMIRETYEHATEMIVAYLESHVGEKRATLCREIDPDNWHKLEQRVSRLQQKRRSEGKSGDIDQPKGRTKAQQSYDVKRGLNNPEITTDAKADLIGQAIEADPELMRATIAKVGQVAAKGVKRQTKEIDAEIADVDPTAHKATKQENAKAVLLMKALNVTLETEEIADLVRDANYHDFTEEERHALRDAYARSTVGWAVIEMAITQMEVTQ